MNISECAGGTLSVNKHINNLCFCSASSYFIPRVAFTKLWQCEWNWKSLQCRALSIVKQYSGMYLNHKGNCRRISEVNQLHQIISDFIDCYSLTHTIVHKDNISSHKKSDCRGVLWSGSSSLGASLSQPAPGDWFTCHTWGTYLDWMCWREWAVKLAGQKMTQTVGVRRHVRHTR